MWNGQDNDVQQLPSRKGWAIDATAHSTRESVERALIAGGLTPAEATVATDQAIGRDGSPGVPHSWKPHPIATRVGVVTFTPS